MPWQEDLARPELSAGCSHCVFENLGSHLCYCLGGRPPGLLPSSLRPAPSSGFLPQEHALLCAFLGGGQDPLHPHSGPRVRTQFCVHVWVSGEQERRQAVRPLSVPALLGADSMHAMFTSLQPEACTEMPASARLAALAGGQGPAEMTWSRSCPAWPQVSFATCRRGTDGVG